MPTPAELEMQQLVRDFLKANPNGGEREIAVEFGVSRPTIDRWKNGVNFPLPGMIPLVTFYLRRRIAEIKNPSGTFSCNICGTTTPLPHVCPAFYPERSTPPT